jgi:hypothetical protein
LRNLYEVDPVGNVVSLWMLQLELDDAY